MYHYIRIAFVAAALALAMVSCTSSQIETALPSETDESVVAPSFALSSDFPSDIVIPDIDGMRSTAFVVSTSMPAAVIAIDIDKRPMELSDSFKGLLSPANSGIPSKLLISSADEAFLATSSSLIYFNPTTGYVYYLTSLADPVEIGSGYNNSDGSEAAGVIEPSYPCGIARIGDRIFVSTANYIRTEAPAVAAPGTVLAFDVSGTLITREGHIVTSAYNPTGLASGNGELIVTNSGVLSIVDAMSVPETESAIDIVDPDELKVISSISLGMAGASFHPVAVTYDGSLGFIGSHAYGNVYEIDLINKQVLRGIDNPIVIADGSDYITDMDLAVDNSYLFAASFEQSSVFPIDLTDIANPAIGNPFVVGYPAGATSENPSGANTGAGPVAVRPGTRGVDYEGEDLFILTGYPGTLIAVKSDSPAIEFAPSASENSDEDGTSSEPPPPPSGAKGDPCQGFAQTVHSVNYGAYAGFGQSNMPNVVLGPPEGGGSTAGSLDVVSLGRFGKIILDLGNCSVTDGPGLDFIVFENAFYIGGNDKAPFAELGTVGVSDDGINFVEFPCISNFFPYPGCAGSHATYSNSSNGISPFDPDAAGGEAYDLSDIGMSEAKYIRIRDVKGKGSTGTAGFDLDAISVINGVINR